MSKPRVQPRKRPLQQRAQSTVDNLLAATARILVEEGFEACNTNRIAREAGYSVGTLYQYFPSKEALVLELGRRESRNLVDRLERRLTDTSGEELTLSHHASALVRETLEAYRAQSALFRAIVHALPGVAAIYAAEGLVRGLQDRIAGWLEGSLPEASNGESTTSAFVLVSTIGFTVNHALLERPELLEDARFQAHLESMMLGYLERLAQ